MLAMPEFNLFQQVCSALHQRYAEFAEELTAKLFSVFSLGAANGMYCAQASRIPWNILQPPSSHNI